MSLILGGSAVGFKEPEDLKLDFKDMVLDGKNINFNQYGPSNPHPGFGKDPNILNEYGHSVYPKMIYPNKDDPTKSVIVNNKEEEDAALNPPSVPQVEQQPKPAANGWT